VCYTVTARSIRSDEIAFIPNGWRIAPGPVASEVAQALVRWHREHNDKECAVYQLPAEL
jgi:hypothetical protein